jgi:hypothetical protein
MERITKVDAAARQIRTAIVLHFDRADPVSIHTLSSAAWKILVDLAKQRNAQTLLTDESYIRPERRSEWRHAIREAQNFFKHADRDPESILEFRDEPTTLFLLDAILLLVQLSGELSIEGNVFLIWFYAKYPDVLSTGVLGQFNAQVQEIELDPNDYQFFKDLIHNYNVTSATE